jgi:uncharacterized protein
MRLVDIFLCRSPSEILLFGTGASTLPPPPFLRAYCQSLGIQLDVMKTVRLNRMSRASRS